MEHIEEAGIHSGDSACMIPPQTLPGYVLEVSGLRAKDCPEPRSQRYNEHAACIQDGTVYVLEANPRSSRTIPFVSKSGGPAAGKDSRCGHDRAHVSRAGHTEEPKVPLRLVKEVLLPFDKLPGADVLLGRR